MESAEAAAAALQAMGDVDRVRMYRYACWRIRGIGRAAAGRFAEDLIEEACLAVCAGRRRWDSETVSLISFMCGVMRSISSHWRKGFAEEQIHLACELRTEETGRDPIESARSEGPHVERARVTAREQLDAIKHFFSQDLEVQLVIEGLAEGMTGPEIQNALRFSKNEYAAAVKRMRRGARLLLRNGEVTRV